jgi:hypothetical protein
MIIYTATSTRTGKFYIGSTASHKHFIARRRYHLTVSDSPFEFHKDLQAHPGDWKWEFSEIDDRTEEEAFLALYVGNKFCYNKSVRADGSGYGGRPKGFRQTDETRVKQSVGLWKHWQNSNERREETSLKMKETNSKKQPCPQCGMLMNVGNLAKHIKGTRCKGKAQVG